MSLDLTDEQRLIRDTSRYFSRAELAPIGANCNRERQWISLSANLQKLAALGFLGVNIEEKYGGAAAGKIAFGLAITEISQVCPITAAMVTVINLVCEVIQDLGTDKQKKEYLFQICSGKLSIGIHLPINICTRSSATDMDMTIMKGLDHYVINGSVSLTVSKPFVGVYAFLVPADEIVEPHRKCTNCFLIEANMQGLNFDSQSQEPDLNIPATKKISFDNCQVPASQITSRHSDALRNILLKVIGINDCNSSLHMGVILNHTS